MKLRSIDEFDAIEIFQSGRTIYFLACLLDPKTSPRKLQLVNKELGLSFNEALENYKAAHCNKENGYDVHYFI